MSFVLLGRKGSTHSRYLEVMTAIYNVLAASSDIKGCKMIGGSLGRVASHHMELLIELQSDKHNPNAKEQ